MKRLFAFAAAVATLSPAACATSASMIVGDEGSATLDENGLPVPAEVVRA